MIDSHCHLADEKYQSDLAEVVARAVEAGLTSALVILSADEPDELNRAADVSRAWPAVRFSAGVHPHRAAPYQNRAGDAAAATRQAVEQTAAVAVGEIGLDYHYDFAPKNVQRDVFAAQVDLAVTLNRPVVIHTRLAAADTMAVLAEAGRGRVRGVMHCFTGTMDEAQLALDAGFFISLSGIVTFPRSAELREVAKLVPADRLLVETDSPFLAPVPHRGRRNEPAWVALTTKSLADVRNVPVAELAAQVSANFDTLFGQNAVTAR